jgi:hypothetical protein
MRQAIPNLDAPALKRAGSRGITRAARFGYLTHGLVYLMMGALALSSALGRGGRITGDHGAVRRLGEHGPGDVLLWAIAIGLACYALWMAVRALLDPERVGRRGAGLLVRVGYAGSACSHALLSLYAFELAADEGGGRHVSIGDALGLPGGRIAIAAIGLGVIAYGLHELRKAIKNDVGQEFAGSDLPHARRRWVERLSRLGHAARGVVFPIIGGSLIAAAARARASEAYDFGEALRELASAPFGSALLAIVALGLIAYGVHMFCVARYGRIAHP